MSNAALPAPIEVASGQQAVLDCVAIGPAERVSLAQAEGRILREEVVASFDLPPFDNSAMDGFALRAGDQGPLRVIDESSAGHPAAAAVVSGSCARIMTGGALPAGADSVIQLEDARVTPRGVELLRAVRPGEHVRRQGEEARAGDLLLSPGCIVSAGEIAVLASTGRADVEVGRRPLVALFTTGDELAQAGRSRQSAEIFDSNSHALAAMIREAGGEARLFPAVADDEAGTVAALSSASEADVIVSTGGVSVGQRDFVKGALETSGAELKFWRVAMKPGKPVVFALFRGKPFFGLPGNPVSAMVTFSLFVAPAIRKFAGAASLLVPRLRCRLLAAVRMSGSRPAYLRVRVTAVDGRLVALPMPLQGSHVVTSMAGANGLAILTPDRPAAAAGEEVDVLLVGAL